MSQVTIELIKRSEDAYNRRDLDAYLTCFHADAELHPLASGVEVNSKAGWIVEARGDKIAYLHSYGDPREALDAAGVQELRSESNDIPDVLGIVSERSAHGRGRMRWQRSR